MRGQWCNRSLQAGAIAQIKLVCRSYFSASKKTCRRSNSQMKLMDESLIKEAICSIAGCKSKLASKEAQMYNRSVRTRARLKKANAQLKDVNQSLHRRRPKCPIETSMNRSKLVFSSILSRKFNFSALPFFLSVLYLCKFDLF